MGIETHRLIADVDLPRRVDRDPFKSMFRVFFEKGFAVPRAFDPDDALRFQCIGIDDQDRLLFLHGGEQAVAAGVTCDALEIVRSQMAFASDLALWGEFVEISLISDDEEGVTLYVVADAGSFGIFATV